MKEIASFSINYHQILNENSELISELPQSITPERLITLYKAMVLLKTFDQKAIALQRTGKMGTYASTAGQEAISTALGHAMQEQDLLVPFYRDYGAMIARGVQLAEIYRYWGGDERGSDYQFNKHDYPICVPIASQCLHACGSAFAFQYRQENRVACVSIGDGGTSEGDFYEAINVAGAWQLPVVFVINNNQWAISVPLSKQTHATTLAQKGIAAGITALQVDGNDMIAMYDCALQAVERARRGEGPTLIEAMTYRLCDHTTADDASRYRPQSEVNSAETKEPINRLKQYLISIGKWSTADETELLESCKADVNKAVEDYLNTSPQPVTAMFDFHYDTLPEALIPQREEAIYFSQIKNNKDTHHA